VPKELPKVSMVNTSLKKLKHHLANFDVVVKEMTTPTAITEVKMNQVLNENERLLEQVMSKDIVNLLVNPSMENDSVNVHECQKCLKLETELQTDFVKRETYDKLFKSFTILEKHCISLEVDTQLKQEIFQRENSVSNQSVPSFDQLFELNELKAQSQEKDTVIKKLKVRIKSLSGKMDKNKIKQDFEEIKTINIELDHRVTKLIAENEHLKQTYKQLYDSIKPAHIQSKEANLKRRPRILSSIHLLQQYSTSTTSFNISISTLKTQVANCTKTNMENKSVNDTLTTELERYKEQVKVLKEGPNVDLRKHLKEKESLLQTVTLLKNDFKKEESRNIDREIALEKQIKQLDNINSVNSSEPTLSIRPTNVEDLFSTFNQHLVDELSKVQNVFYQMEQAVEQHHIESKTFEVKMNQVLNENERLLEQVMSKDIVNLIANSSVDNDSVNVRECQKCLKLETELQTDFVKRETYDKLFKVLPFLKNIASL
ncbi:hypothetical protein Tco_1433035, partial [Tanacetum coccineum]